jgi:hypothetical protein
LPEDARYDSSSGSGFMKSMLCCDTGTSILFTRIQFHLFLCIVIHPDWGSFRVPACTCASFFVIPITLKILRLWVCTI